jgi:uncharacterized protein (TIGR03000 family)
LRRGSPFKFPPVDPNIKKHTLGADIRRKIMFSSGSSLLRRAAAITAALVLGLTAAQSGHAQPTTAPPTAPIPTGGAQSYRELGPAVPEIYEAGGGQTRTNTGQATTTPVFTPGYFEVVCPAICYGGAFRVTNNRAFAGAGYYGPFRRYWAYGTYGPSFNIGPDNSLQYGLVGGCIYETQRACHGLYKHGHDCACGKCPHCAKGGSAAAAYGPIGQIASSVGASPSGAPQQGAAAPQAPSRPPAEKLPQPTPNSAHLQLLVPENAEVLVEGSKTATTGTIREFESPPLTPGKNMLYSITVRYTDAAGKPVEETHSVRVRANDQLRIDCTKPAEKPLATVQRP